MGSAGILAGLWVLAVVAIPAVDAQTVRGLVIGIDDYRELRDLAGAVNDARDVARALSRAGVMDLTVLENGAATRERISAEWHRLMARAAPGDTLVLTYAGHGGQEPERVAGTERDGRDEVLLLGGFQSSGPGTRERIFDDELNRWFAGAGERGLRVVFVADSCHAGTLTRSIDPRAPTPRVRTARYTVADDMLELEMPEAAALDEAELEHVSFLAAGQEYEQVPEVALPGERGRIEPRGALSYTFARAVEGEADTDGDGVLRRSELWRFVRENVRMVSEARQTPNLLPNTGGNEFVLRVASPSRPGSNSSEWQPGGTLGSSGPINVESSLPLRLVVLAAAPATLAAVRDALPEVDIVSLQDSPDLIWDAGARQVVTGMGDVAAYDVDLESLSAAVDKWEAVRAIRALSRSGSLSLRVRPHDGVHRRGSRIEIEVDGLHRPRLTLIGLSGNGTVHYLYPLLTDPVENVPARPFRLEVQVAPPFGADHVVAVSADSSLEALNAGLARLDGRIDARRAAQLIAAAAVAARGWRSGIQGLFTAP